MREREKERERERVKERDERRWRERESERERRRQKKVGYSRICPRGLAFGLITLLKQSWKKISILCHVNASALISREERVNYVDGALFLLPSSSLQTALTCPCPQITRVML